MIKIPCFVIYKDKKYTKEEFRNFLQEGDNHVTLYNDFKKLTLGNRVEAEQGEEVKPITAYHVSNIPNITEFKTSGKIETAGGMVDNVGVHFTPDKGEYKHKGDYEYTANLNIKNPYVTEDQKEIAIITPERADQLKTDGYDGVVLMRNGKPAEYVVFDSKQIEIIQEPVPFTEREQAPEVEQVIEPEQIKEEAEPPIPPEVPPIEVEEKPLKEPVEKEKALLNRFLKAVKLSDKFKEHVKRYGTTYTSIPNDVTAEEADYILASNGATDSESMVYDTKNNLPMRVRGLLGVRLIEMLDMFADAAEKEGDIRGESKYRLRSAKLANWLDDDWGRELGRGVQIFGSTEVMAALAPKTHVIVMKQKVRKQRDTQINDNKKDINTKSKSMEKANKESIDEVLKSKIIEELKKKISELEVAIESKSEPKPAKTLPADKIKRERQYIANQWDKFKKASITPLSSSIVGLNSEQIEAIGNIIGAYVRLGIYKTEDLVLKLKKDWLKNTGNILADKDARKLLPNKVDGKTLEEIEKEGDIKNLAEQLTKRVERLLKDPKIPKDDPLRQLLDTLYQKIEEKDTKEKVPREKKTDIEKIRQALVDKERYADVWEAAKEKVVILIATNEELSEEQKVEYNQRLADFYNEIIGKPFSEKQAERATKKGIKDLGIEIDRVVRDHYTVYDAAKRILQEKLIEELGLGEAQSKMFAEAIGREFDKIAIAKKRAILQRGIKPKEVTQPKKAKLAWEKLIELTNMGAFSDAEFAEAYADAWGFPKLTPEQVKEIERLAKKVYNAPEGFQKYERVQDLLAYEAKLPGLDLGDFAMGMWYSTILSGFRTQFKNVFANTMNTFFELIVAGAKDPRNLPGLMWGLLNGWQKGGYEFTHILRKGYMPIRGFKIESPIDLELNKFRGGGWNPMNWFKYVPRFMVAADAFSYGGLKEMRAYEMAMNEARKLNKEAESPTMDNWAKATEILNKTSERLAEAEIQAEQEGLKKDSKTKEDRGAYKRRVWEIMEQGRGQTIIEDSTHFAAHGTFNYKPEGIIGLLTEFVASLTYNASIRATVFGRQFTMRPAKFIIPFTRIIANVADVALDYYPPVGLIRGVTGGVGLKTWKGGKLANKYRKYTPEERKKVWIKFAIGSMAQVGLYLLSEPPDDDKEQKFEITANGYGDYKKNHELKESGWQPYSIRIGKVWLSYQYTPLVLALAPVGLIRDFQKYKGEKYNEKDLISLIGISYFRSLRVMGDMTWATSLTGLMDAMNAKNEEQAIGYAKNMLTSTVKGIIYPKLAEQTVQFIDKAQKNPRREASTVLGKIMRDIPIVRSKYNTMLNAVGEPVMYDPIQMLNVEVSDPFWDYINEHKINIGKPNQRDLIYDDINKIERGMTDDEYFNFIETSGREIKKRIMEEMMVKELSNEDIKKESDNIKTEVRRTTIIEIFGWGDFRQKNEKQWDVLRKYNAVKIPTKTPIVWLDENDKKATATEEEMEFYNNEAMKIYAEEIIDYFKSGDVSYDKETINLLTGQSDYEKEISEIWSKANADAKKAVIEKREK